MSGSLFSVSSGVCISSVKCSEDNKGLVIRAYDTMGKDRRITFGFVRDVLDACITDFHENELSQLAVEDNKVSVDLKACSVLTIKVKL